jgi:hypothetical protein
MALSVDITNGDDVGLGASLHAADGQPVGEGYAPSHRWEASTDQVPSDQVRIGDWTCVVGEFENGSRMVTVAKWRDGAIAEEYIWM